MAQSRQHSRMPRNLLIGFLVLLILYSLAGFLLLPWWLEKLVPDQLEQRMGWQADVGEISSNPFALSVEALNLSAQDSDNEKVVGLDRLYINLNFFELIRGVVGFEAIELDEPFIRLDLLEDYSVNFARDFQAANAGEGGKPAEPEKGQTPPSLYFKQFTVNGGELLFRDFTQPEMVEFRIIPLDLTLSDLATWQRDDRNSDYHLQAALGSQTIEWQGNLSVTPLYSSGNLAISGVDHKTLGHFLAPYLPYDLRGGKVTVRSDYELQSGDILSFSTSNGRFSVEDLAVAPDKQSEQPRLTTASIVIDDIGFDLNTREARVGPISLEQPDIALARNKAGEIDWVAALAAFNKGSGKKEPGAEAPEPAAAARPFRWSLESINVSGGRVLWQDQQPGSPAELTLEQLSLSMGDISSEMENPMSYQLQAALASGGKLSLNGQLTPRPFTLEAAIAGSGILLAVFEPYLQESANIAVADGTLGLDGNLNLDSQQEPLTGTFNGTAEVSGLNLQLPGSNERLISWQTLRLAPIEYNVHPARLEIGTVTLAQPAINLVRNTDSVHNVEQIILSSGAVDASAQPKQETGEDARFIFRIGQLMIEKGALDYTDRTLDPAFTTSLDQLNGTVTGLSNISPQQGKVSVKGRVGGSASVEFDGTIGTLGTEETSDLKLTMKDLSLPVLSPYFGRYLGYAVDSGKLALDLDYEITGSRIKASNRVVMDRLGLGQAIASQQAVNAPVKLGLALLRNSSGVIEMNLPISGDMASPDFSVGQVVMRAFVNLLAKAATSPFSVLGSIAELAGLSGEELGQMSFEPGKTRLVQGEAEKLAALAEALLDRPDLLLNIRGGVSPSVDGLALLRDELAANQNGKLSEQNWEEARKAYLAGERPLAPEVLNNLASARGASVQEILRDTHNVPASQLFMLDPSRNAEVSDDGNVIVEFTLDAR
ncbi:Uncharacterized protein involved in outer membrane biogenesis [Marinobacter antarcticus]|uniref:Uncharacterized protein involved in outer membrane biogenesis n=1 Tax=Marinobacter antarcticus TaxID=564117 RepID=A0A1M6PP99_9GAMM|nr:Uncharacterized protein involved in outer membrane biogenesis [Marinobacter antarcticus]